MASPLIDKKLQEIYINIGSFVGGIAGVIAFFGSWYYCIEHYGYLWGFGFGWVPSIIAAAIAFFVFGFGWPLLVIYVLYVLFFWKGHL